MKRCGRCKKSKPLTEFYRASKSRDGYAGYCKTCSHEAQQAWRKANPDRAREHERGRNAYKREHERNHRAPCPECGEPMRAGSGCATKRPERCWDCRVREAHDRTERWLELRRRGLNNKDIAVQEGVTVHAVANLLQRRRVDRYPDLTWTPAPYAAHRGVGRDAERAA